MERPRFLQVTHIHDHEFVGFLDVAYSNDDTVAQFKNRLSMGTPYKVVKLLYHGLLIENARELLDLIPDFRDVGLPRLSVHTETPGGDHVIVKSTIGEFKVYLPLNSTIEQLKEKIEEELQYFCETLQRPCFLFAGRRLEHKCTLLQCGLVCGSTLRLLFVTNGRGGGAGYRSPTLFVDTENSEALEKWNFSSSGPQWRIADRGLNIEGKCKNKSCAAYGQMVICNKGLTVFNMAQESSCPVCSCYFEATTCAFTNCMWMFEGRKRGPGSDISSKWYMAGNKYELFREGGNSTNHIVVHSGDENIIQLPG